MLLYSRHAVRLDRLTDRLRLAPVATPDLIRSVIAGTCKRLPCLSKAGKAGDIDKLISAGAWTDAALLLIELELPGWSLRRLVRDDGEWFCSLSCEPNLPEDLDDTADGSHQVAALAIWRAFLEARRKVDEAREAPSSVGPSVGPALGHAICCDNFS